MLAKIQSYFTAGLKIGVLLLILCMTLTGCSGLKRYTIRVTDIKQPLVQKVDVEGMQTTDKKFKVLHVMSYFSPWEWTDTQFNGFQEALKGLDIEYKVIQMDAKNNSTEKGKEAAGRAAREVIDTWKPDLVYTSDDEAQEYVTKYYVNSSIPYVFSGVNNNPSRYEITPSKNITGVLEVEHFVESAKLLKDIIPDVKRIAVIIDDSQMWCNVEARMKANLHRLPELEFIIWDKIPTFADYKKRLREYESVVDAVALVDIFNFKDEAGNNVHYREVLRWTAENSALPDFSFWKDRVSYGTLCAVSVSGYEQGLAAGKIARGILVDGKSPSDYPIEATTKGQPFINRQRVEKLGLKVNSKTLLSAQIIHDYEWNKQEK